MRILLAEDNPADVYLLRESLRSHPTVELEVVYDGEEALDFVFRRNSFAHAAKPDLIVLDLNLPKSDGNEVLSAIRSTSDLSDVPVMILTSSDSPKDRTLALMLGANSFLTKPSDLDQFMALGDVIVTQCGSGLAAAAAMASNRTRSS